MSTCTACGPQDSLLGTAQLTASAIGTIDIDEYRHVLVGNLILVLSVPSTWQNAAHRRAEVIPRPVVAEPIKPPNSAR
ncbi:hypothetical protein PHLCEN_2v3215 [Hermanssonia centrifuga]|uniref:Uncharacterized protein n=1 Tax=Hermanssonia centrifuga TaxID=98765 RepID=A0A2R6QXN4_9APHY|nr:hypothetical protein PHLCEN_2v3215 [Hermanssonia centrifuga]